MTAIMEEIKQTTELRTDARKKEIIKKMVENGQQVPLIKLMSYRDIMKLVIKDHVIIRYKQRFERLYNIEIENMIKNDLINGAIIVEDGYNGRFKVYSKGIILVMDENAVFTTYDATGNDRNNVVDSARARLKKFQRKTPQERRLDSLFAQISN